MFVKRIGMSPFIKTFLKRNTLMAIVIGIQRIRNIENGSTLSHYTDKGDDKNALVELYKFIADKARSPDKYNIIDPKRRSQFENTLQNRDMYGNNVSHYLFDVWDKDIRYQLLQVSL